MDLVIPGPTRVLADSFDSWPICANRLHGLVQAAARAELFAAWQALDCQTVLKGLQQLLDGTTLAPSGANQDILAHDRPTRPAPSLLSVHKVRSHQRGDDWSPGAHCAQEANVAVDEAARLAALQCRPGELDPWQAALHHYTRQKSQLDSLILLHLALLLEPTLGARLSRINLAQICLFLSLWTRKDPCRLACSHIVRRCTCGARAQALSASARCARTLLPHRFPPAIPAIASPPQVERVAGALHRLRGLSLPTAALDAHCCSVKCPGQKLTLGFVLSLGRLPPPYVGRLQRCLGQGELASWLEVDTSVSAVVASFREPLLSSLNWPTAPFRVPGSQWRWTAALHTRVYQTLFQCYPAGIQCRSLACPSSMAVYRGDPPADEHLFLVGIAAPGPPSRGGGANPSSRPPGTPMLCWRVSPPESVKCIVMCCIVYEHYNKANLEAPKILLTLVSIRSPVIGLLFEV